MKKLTKILSAISILCFVFIANAEIQLLDDFTVTGGGGISYQYDTRQSGPLAPIGWYNFFGPATVTNEGPRAGKAFIDSSTESSYFGLSNDFTLSNYSIEYSITRNNPIHYYRMYWGGDTMNGRQTFFAFTGVAGYNTWEDGSWLGDGTDGKLSNATHTVKVVVSNNGNSNPKSALFIDNIAYAMTTSNRTNMPVYTYTHQRTFVNNYVSFLDRHASPAVSTADIDDFNIMTPDYPLETYSWTSDADSGITNSKTYTHAVNLAGTDVAINGVDFEGSGLGTESNNWKLNTLLPGFGIHDNSTINVSGNSSVLLSNFFFKKAVSLTLTGLTSGQPYLFTQYGMGFDPAGRESYLATSSGSITNLYLDEFGQYNGILVKHYFIAPSNGIFSISATPISSEWHWYAFSNEEAGPFRPKSISASQGTYNNKIVINWDFSDNADSYILYRSASSNYFSSTEISTTATNYYEDSVTTATKYYYWVKACNSGGCSELTGPVGGFTGSANPPNTPANISPIDYNVITSPVTLVATAYSDPGNYAFAEGQWQVSKHSDFSTIYFDRIITTNINSFTLSGNSISDGTNYWRLRYMNEYNTKSSWSTSTTFIYILDPSIKGVFSDNFNAPGDGDINVSYASKGRQSGYAAPLTYATTGTTKAGSESEYPGELQLKDSGGFSPNNDFNNLTSFKVEFDFTLLNVSDIYDYVSLSFARDNQNDFNPDDPSGLGMFFRGNAVFKNYDAGELKSKITDAFSTNKTGKSHIVLTASTEDFDYFPFRYSIFIDGEPMILDTNNFVYIYEKPFGFKHNYMFLKAFNSSIYNSTLIDNFIISEVINDVTVTNWLGDSDIPVDASKVTHAVNINGDSVEINGVNYIGTGTNFGTHVNGSAILQSNGWVLSGTDGNVIFHNTEKVTNAVLDPRSRTLMEYFAFFNSGSALKLSGLTPMSTNIISIFSYGWENSGRVNYFSSDSGGSITNIDQDTFGTGGGIIVQYSYTANPYGEFTLVISPPNSSSFHISGFCNEEIAVVTENISVPTAIDFGKITPGESRVLQFDVLNLGDGIVSGSISGVTAPFSLANSYYATAATADTINITFSPLAGEDYSETITFTGIGGNAQISLTGTGVPEPVIFGILNFGFWILYIVKRQTSNV